MLYQKRVTARGHAFAQDTPWQHEMEEAFPFVETPDQRTAIDDIKRDMEVEHPMDRLLCGDVGFGKTEVAIRAAFKAIQGGKQVAVLAPTTLLATQHGNTFADRFAGYPIRVEVLSRFLTNAQAKQVIAGVKSGEVDCVIGTHRLLGADINFKDLGLLIVDEEQRFGVQHKETMKKMKTNVDVLTLSATPIPRTLEMSLVGIRDLSLLQTPPADRQPILTFVGEYDERVAIEAIRRELLREGQVFWVHNRVRSIDTAAARLRQLVPEARIAIAHGQLDEGTLETVVQDFWDGKYDVLVCTTIIESGIDMPTVNTLVVERSDLLGLGQMHQLRGRVGRSGQRAYAYLFHPRDKVLSEEAYERLRTIGESTELGSGFKIAMRDLEIRGAGNLLGESQSGHIAAVGYDLYCQMVTEAVSEMKGEPQPSAPAEIKLDVPSDSFLPADYVAKEELRFEAYRRLAAVETAATVDDIRTEWEDRYGPLPEPAEALLQVGYIRAECHRLGIRDIQISTTEAKLGPIHLKLSETMRLRRLSKAAKYKEDLAQLVLPLPRRNSERAAPRPRHPSRQVPPRPRSRRRTGALTVADTGELDHVHDHDHAGDSVRAVNRRLTILLPLVATVLGAGCATFTDNDAVARVGDVEFSSTELRDRADERGAPQDEALDANAVRDEIAVWIDSQLPTDNDPILAAATYARGVKASGSICVEVLVVDSQDEVAAALEELNGGVDFGVVFATRNIDPSLAAEQGSLGCLPAQQLPFGIGNPFVDSLLELDTEHPYASVELVGNEGDPAVYAVSRFVPFDELGPEDTPVVVESLSADALGIDIYVDPRYGIYDELSGNVIALG